MGIDLNEHVFYDEATFSSASGTLVSCMLYAHTPNEAGDWHPLEDHLIAVAEMAAGFAEAFGAGELARLLGLWHDLGKANPQFAQYLRKCHQAKAEGRQPPARGTPHAIWGAAFAYQILRRNSGLDRWYYLALPIQGHHGQLADVGTGGSQVIEEFLDSHTDAYSRMEELFSSLREKMEGWSPRISLPDFPRSDRELYTRLLFSTLIDADRLDTEAHWSQHKSDLRLNPKPTLSELNDALSNHGASFEITGSFLNQVQREVRESCVKAATSSSGMFRLTVPTGAGKTLSSMAFALGHALRNDLKRVIVALPYTSIIEQNAKVYRDIPGFGDVAVLEHHSAIELADDLERQDEKHLRAQLAAENWDMPIVVTTTVQLFESLFSNRASAVRKLHRLAGSVIILDEIQAFPPKLLLPTIDILKTLARPVESGGYGATVVLCTATQPSFDTELLSSLLKDTDIREIVPNYREYFAMLRRVDYEWKPTPVSWRSLAEELRTES